MNILTGLEFRPLAVPDSLGSVDAADFLAMTDVRNRVYREVSGHDDHTRTAEELLPHYQPDDDEARLLWLILDDDEPVGRIGVDLPREKGSRASFALIEIVRDHWGRGIGTRAHEVIERAVREHGRSVIQSWAENPEADGERLSPPTGFGTIPRDHIARFYLAQGYTLEQIARNSALDLTGSFGEIERLFADAQAASIGYRILQWAPPTPPQYAEGYAWMKSRMSTDAPAAALEFDEERWDADRLARHDKKYTDAGMTVLVTAAQHVETGELCAFNELSIGHDLTAASHQEDTLVLKEHRGHRLGMLVKCAGLLAWRDIAPESPRMITYNAEENRPMLDINEALGFVPIAYEGAWKKTLT